MVGKGNDPSIKAVKDPAISGYAHAGVVTRPWMVRVDGRPLVDKWKRPRRFATEAAAVAAARRSR
jgi:hypothetical protein